MTHARRRFGMAALAAFLLVGALFVAPAAPQAANPPVSPDGLTAMSLDGRVALAWEPSADATSYQVYRGTTPGTITTLITPAGHTATTFTDTSAANGTTYYYEVRATGPGGQSVAGQRTTATPRARSCSTGNAVRVENCFPGTTAWKGLDATRWYPSGIEGFLSKSSVDAGGSVDLRVNTSDYDVPYHVEIYRTGAYGGDQGRLVGTVPGLIGGKQYCSSWPATTGLADCSPFNRTATITTTHDWVSGVYLLKLVRDDNGEYSHALLVVRADGSHSNVLYGVPTNTYQAYNAYAGKSLYSYNSDGPATDSTANRAVQVSFDRPYQQPTGNSNAHDWYTRTDLAWVSWLESQGYDTTYVASEDVDSDGGQLTNHKVYVSGAHDEYWTQGMFDAVKAARDAGTSIVFAGANASYWRVRYLPSPVTGTPRRVMVGYKSIESGPADPSGFSTSTFRDPAGPNQPENALIGQMYIGDKRADDFPLRVSAQEGRSRVWRYTSVANLAAGTTAAIGTSLVGWEWDQRFDNGLEPAGVQTLSTSAVAGNVLQDNGHTYATGNTQSNSTIYRAAGGALVFSTGTNNWWRGLALNMHGEGEPDNRVKQATVNVLDDMGVAPTTPASEMQLDAAGAPTITARTPAPGATSVGVGAAVRATFDRELDPATVDGSDLWLTTPAGATVPATVTVDNATRSIVLKPAANLAGDMLYTAHVGTAFTSWHGDAPAAGATWTFSTGQGAPPALSDRAPAAGATGVATDAALTATFDRALDPASLTTASFSARPAAGGAAIAGTVSYDAATHTARLQPAAALGQSTAYTATLSTAVTSADGVPLATPATWTFTTGTDVTVTSRVPAAGATGVSTQASVRAVFSRAVDASTVGATALRLTTSGGLTIGGTVSYDPATRTATLAPASALAAGAAFTVTAGAGVRGADGAPTQTATWSFATGTTSAPPPAPVALSPASGATEIATGTPVTATFDRALDPATVTASTVTLAPEGGSPVAASVAYDDAAHRITLTPLAALSAGRTYIAAVSTQVRSSDGVPLADTATWSFTTAGCPCTLMAGLTPAWTGLTVQDGRSGSGPFTYELGTKVAVSETTSLVALRFWKEPGETGTHVGRVWSSNGTQLASVTYQGESASGWQRQALATPLTLSPGQTYVISVGLNAFYAKTTGGLATAISAGPLHTVADGNNGVFNLTSGQFPSDTWSSSNYFVDGVVAAPGGSPPAPGVTTRTPAAGATGVAASTHVTAAFSTAMDASSITTSTFRLATAAGTLVPAQVSYDAASRTATLDPSAALEPGTAYTATLTTGVRSADDVPLPAAASWSFSTAAQAAAPTVTATAPVNGATGIGGTAAVTATFSQAMDAGTISGTSFTLSNPSGATVSATVAYDAATHTATLTPASALAPGTTYTARLSTAVASSEGVALAAAYSWSFATSDCPCRLFGGAYAPSMTNLSTANGRSGAGWTLEMGVKIRVATAAELTAIRYYRSPGESGTHVGRVWNAAGQQIATATFSGETASGWQEQALAAPVALAAGQTYVVSVGLNERFVQTIGTFSNPVASGPLASIADGANGVFADAAGTFPTQYWGNSDYGIDAVVR